MLEVSREAKLGAAKLIFMAGRSFADEIKPDARGFLYVPLERVEHNASLLIVKYDLTGLLSKDDFPDFQAARKELGFNLAVPLGTHPNGPHAPWIKTSNDLLHHVQTKSGIIIPTNIGYNIGEVRQELDERIAEELDTRKYNPQNPMKIWV